MDLLDELRKEHSAAQTRRLVAYVGADPERFSRLFHLFSGDEPRIAQRASRVVDGVVETFPFLLDPHFPVFLHNLSRKDLPDAVRRNSVRMLQFIALPEEYHGEIARVCFDFLRDPGQPVAVKAFSMTVLHRLTETYPELGPELAFVLQERLELEKPAYWSRAVKILRHLNQ